MLFNPYRITIIVLKIIIQFSNQTRCHVLCLLYNVYLKRDT